MCTFPPRLLRESRRSALVCALALVLAASGCQSAPRKVPSWVWPPPLGVALLRGTVAQDDGNRSADPLVVYLVPVETVAPLPSLGLTAVVRWRNGAFEPDTVALRKGARVQIVNEGALQHRLFTAGDRAIHLELPAHGEHVLQVGKRGASHIYCSLHPSEYLFVYASPQRYVGTVGSDGSWSIGPVAPGDYRLMLWSPSEDGFVRTVRIWPWTVQSQRLRLEPEPN